MADKFIQYEYAQANGIVYNNPAFRENFTGSDYADSGLGPVSVYLKFSIPEVVANTDNLRSIYINTFYIPDGNGGSNMCLQRVQVRNNNGQNFIYAALSFMRSPYTNAVAQFTLPVGSVCEIAFSPSVRDMIAYRIDGGQTIWATSNPVSTTYAGTVPLYSLRGITQRWNSTTQEAEISTSEWVCTVPYRLYRLALTTGGSADLDLDSKTKLLDVVPVKSYLTGGAFFLDQVTGKTYAVTDYYIGGQIFDDSAVEQSNVTNVYIGSVSDPAFYFNKDTLIAIGANMAIDAIGNELTIDTLDFTVYHDDADGALRALTYATPIFYYQGSDLIGKFYFKNIERTASKRYHINAVSVVGLLEYEKHYGGMYQGKNVKEAVRETLISNGLQRYIGKEYAEMTSQSGSLPLAPDYVGPSVAASGTQTAVLVVFSVEKIASSAYADNIWLNVIERYNDVDGWFFEGVSIAGYTQTHNKVNVYCSFASSANQSPVGSFYAKPGDVIELLICPYLGRYYYRINGESVYLQSFTAITVNYLMPIWGLTGIAWYDDSYGLHTTNATYRLYQLMFGSRDGTWSSTYMNLAVAKDLSTGEELFYDTVTGNSFPVTGSATIESESRHWYYQAGGENVDVDSPAFLNSADASGELAMIADSIAWQSGADALTFNGWIPTGTKRETLHQILFALNLNMYKSSDGSLIIGTLPTAVDDAILDAEIYNTGSVEEVKKPKKIELTEHSYNLASGSAEEVFDNTSATIGDEAYVAEFNKAPIYGRPTSETVNILTYNANAAVVTGKGIIRAQFYNHSTRIISATIGTRPDGETISVSNATLVTFLNATNVMNKLKAYYANAAYKIKNAILAGDRKLGRKYSLLTPFSEEADAYLTKINLNASNILKFDCEFLAGYAPTGSGNIYNNVVQLTGSGIWTVPDGVEQIHLVLIGGGDGGEGGAAGEDGQTCDNWSSTTPAKGGTHGENGLGGKVYEVDVPVTPGDTFAFACGEGGIGGGSTYDHDTHEPGNPGGDTTFGEYSSAHGPRENAGFIEVFSGKVYARSLEGLSFDGGDGGAITISSSGNRPTRSQITILPPAPDSITNPMTGYRYDSGGHAIFAEINGVVTYVSGSGGGCAMGEDADRDFNLRFNGGDGATVQFRAPKANNYNPDYYGYGGAGGCGGGGGGAAGYQPDEREGTPGSGGWGGPGGQGGDGTIFVYF